MVKIKVGADLSPAQAEVDKYQGKVATAAKASGEALAKETEAGALKAGEALKATAGTAEQAGKKAEGAAAGAGEALGKETEAGAQKAGEALKETEGAAEKTAKGVKSIADGLNVGKAISALGALKGMVNDVGVDFLGMDAKTAKATSTVLDMAQKGAQLGATFGPWGALLGGVVGGALGIFTARAQAARDKATALVETSYRVAEAQREVAAQIRAVNAELDKTDTKSLSSALNEFDAVGTKIDAAYAEIQRLKDEREKGHKLATAAGKGWDEAADTKIHDAIISQTDLLSGLIAAKTKAGKLVEESTKKQISADKDAVASAKELDGLTQGQLKLKKASLEEQINLTSAARDSEQKWQAEATKPAEKARYARLVQENTDKLNAQRAALDKVTASLKGNETATKSAGDATAEATEAITDSVTVTVNAAAKGQKSQLLNISFYASEAQKKVVETAKKAKAELDGLLGGDSEAATKGATDKFFTDLEKEAEARVAKNPIVLPLVVLPDPKGLNLFKAGAAMVKQQAIDTAAAVASALGQQAVKGINAFFDAYANGVKRSAADRKRAAVEFERAVGTQLMSDAVGHIVMGGVKAIVPLTRAEGLAEMAAGGAEFAIGAAMGGVGAIGQKRLGGVGQGGSATQGGAAGGSSSSLGGSSGSAGGASFGGSQSTQDLPPAIIQLAPGGTVVFPSDPRGKAGFGRFTLDAQASANKAGAVRR